MSCLDAISREDGETNIGFVLYFWTLPLAVPMHVLLSASGLLDVFAKGAFNGWVASMFAVIVCDTLVTIVGLLIWLIAWLIYDRVTQHRRLPSH